MIATPVLVTGAQGWLGTQLVARLRRDGGEGLYAPGRAELDLADEGRVARAFEEMRPRQVVHLASSLDRGDDPKSHAAQWRDTFLAGRNVVQASSRVGVQHLVMAGSIEELGDHVGVLETDVSARPRTMYGLCKSLVREVASFQARRAPLRIDWFRPTTVYGPGQAGDMVVPHACAAARSGRPAEFTDGAQSRDFLYVDDLIDWLVLALDAEVAEQGGSGFHLHHLGTGVARTVREVLEQIAAQMPGAQFDLGARPRYLHEPLVQVAPEYSDANPTLASWRAVTLFSDGITRTIAWWKTQPG